MLQLEWKPDFCSASLVAKKVPYKTSQPVFARIYLNNQTGNIIGWQAQMYISTMWPRNDTEVPVTQGGWVCDKFKQTQKKTEEQVIRWFKNMGVEVEIAKPTFLNEDAFKIDASKIPQSAREAL